MNAGRLRVVARAGAWALVLLLAAAAVHEEHRVQRDSAFCATSCHHDVRPGGDATHATGHAGVTCQGCHATREGEGLRLLWESWVHAAPQEHGAVTARDCVRCHEGRPAEWRPVAATRGHREHEGRPGVDCLSCHAPGIHRPEAPEAACLSCHQNQTLHAPDVAGVRV